jgi:two-component system OmpR family sensor kinase
MEFAGTGDRVGHRAARSWHAVRRVSDRTSLRTKLVVTVLVLVLAALAAMGFAGVSLLRGQLLGTYATSLQQESGALLPCLQYQRCPSGLAVYYRDSSGNLQVVSYGANAYSPNGTSQPDLSGSAASWLADNPQQPTTIAAASGSGPWLAMGFAENGGTLILAVDVSGVYTTIRQLTDVDLIVSVAILLVLVVVGFAVVQANLRPLVEIEETAGEIAAGHLNRRVPERDPRTEIGRLGRSLNTMLSQIETAFHAREKSEAAAHQSEERMRRFIADASHELRTPLTAIRGFAEYYRQRGGVLRYFDDESGLAGPGGGLTAEDLDRIMQRVEAEAARMGLLVEDLLLLARLDQQRPLARQPVDLLSLAADAVHDARLLAPSRAIDLSVQPGAAFLVIGDEPRLRQIIGNLMSNALGHTPDGTPIELSISSGTLDPRRSKSAPAVILDVTDHGPGMAPEQAHRVFERFYRADQARTRKAGGSGLGLAIVAALVAAHGGVASVRTAPGQGATFRIALPLAPEAHDDDPDEFDLAYGGDEDDAAEYASVADEIDLADEADGTSGAADGTGATGWNADGTGATNETADRAGATNETADRAGVTGEAADRADVTGEADRSGGNADDAGATNGSSDDAGATNWTADGTDATNRNAVDEIRFGG